MVSRPSGVAVSARERQPWRRGRAARANDHVPGIPELRGSPARLGALESVEREPRRWRTSREHEPDAQPPRSAGRELEPDGRDARRGTREEGLDPYPRAPGAVHPVVAGAGRGGPHVDRLTVVLNRAVGWRRRVEPALAVEHADPGPVGHRSDAGDVARAVFVHPPDHRGLGADPEGRDHDADAAVADKRRRRARRIVGGEEEGGVSRRIRWRRLRVETNGGESVTAPESERGQHSRRRHPASPLPQLRAAVWAVRPLRGRTTPIPGTAEAESAGRGRPGPWSPAWGCLPRAPSPGMRSAGRG